MMNYRTSPVDSVLDANPYNPLSWRAILAGAFFAVSSSLMINLLNIGLGLSAYSVGGEVKTIGIVTFLWTLICVFSVMFIAGHVSGSSLPRTNFPNYCAIKQGLITWSVSVLLMLVLTGFIGIILPVNLQAISSVTNASLQVENDKIQPSSIRGFANNLENQSVEHQRVNRENNTAVLAALSFQAFLILLIGAIASVLGALVSSQKYGVSSQLLSSKVI